MKDVVGRFEFAEIRRPVVPRLRAWIVLLALVTLPSDDVAACIYPSNEEFNPRASTELVPPGPVTIESATIVRESDRIPSDGCGEDRTYPCDVPVLHVRVAAIDDVTPANELGFHVRIVDGPRPAKLHTPDPNVDRRATTHDGGTGVLYFTVTLEEGGADFVLVVSAIDLSGNVGPETTVRITYGLDNELGCASARDVQPFGALVLALATLALVLRRRSLRGRG